MAKSITYERVIDILNNYLAIELEGAKRAYKLKVKRDIADYNTCIRLLNNLIHNFKIEAELTDNE